MPAEGKRRVVADPEFVAVKRWLSSPDRTSVAGKAIRQAIDWVIDGARTRRYRVDQLKPGEKTYIGNRVEHELLHEWGLLKEGPLDTIIEGVAVDIKFSLSTSWMIPPEAIDKLCVIVTADDDASLFSFGLFRARRDHLAQGKGNRDGKRSLTKSGRDFISWIARDAKLPANFLLHIDADVRDKIFSHRRGQQRVNELFRLVQGVAIPNTALDTVAVQRDPSKRVRANGGAKDYLEKEGIIICGARYDKRTIKHLGLEPLPRDHWMSIKVGNDKNDVQRILNEVPKR
jgi:hypothetical protein